MHRPFVPLFVLLCASALAAQDPAPTPAAKPPAVVAEALDGAAAPDVQCVDWHPQKARTQTVQRRKRANAL